MSIELNIFSAALILIAGFVLLWKSADLLVAGAVDLASRLGISALVIGLTVVAMGTSAPEVAASITASLKNAGEIAIGNVYGSNIANLALIGGLCAIIHPLRIQIRIIKREIPIMLISALLLWPFLSNLNLSRLEGFILIALFALVMILTILAARKEATLKPDTNKLIRENIDSEIKIAPKSIKFSIFLAVAGMAGLAIGSNLAIAGAVFIGQKAGLSQAVIGLTIVAVGTSLPELATSLAAALKGRHDISIGNLVGSNIFNTLLVTGTASSINPLSISKRLAGPDYWIMIAVTAAFIIMAGIGKKITRKDGIILIASYVAYIIYLLTITPAV